MDAVVIATPPACHAPQATAALKAGMHVMSEIPTAVEISEARALVRAARAAKKIYMAGENCCYLGLVSTWREFVRSGRLGKPLYAEGEYIHDVRNMFRRRWTDVYFPDGKLGGPNGLTWRARFHPLRYSTHEIGPLLEIVDDRVTRVMAVDTGCNVSKATGTIDMGVALMQTAGGVTIKEQVAFSIAQPMLRYFCLYGTKVAVETPRWSSINETLAYFEDVPDLKGKMRIPLTEAPKRAYPPWVTAAGHGGIDGAMMLDFIDAIWEGRPSPIDVYRGLDYSLPGILSAASAAKGGVWMDVPDPRKW